jgi:hypothetical protein
VLLLLAIYIDSINATVILYLQPINAYINIFGIVFATGASFNASTPFMGGV